jgi:hypothetical protein
LGLTGAGFHLFALFAAVLSQLIVFAAAFVVAAFDFAGDLLLVLFGFTLCALGSPTGIFLTLFADPASLARRDIALRRRSDQPQAGEGQSNRQ